MNVKKASKILGLVMISCLFTFVGTYQVQEAEIKVGAAANKE